MAKLKDLFDAIHVSTELNTTNELKAVIALIEQVQEFDSGERDTIKAAFADGPLWDGDVPSKAARDRLVAAGFIAKVAVKGEQGYNACTHKGCDAVLLIAAGA